MTEQEQQWFDALTKDRADGADMLKKPYMRGVESSVVDKYSDQAHFIYELLQNADDVKATTAKFRVEESGLYFTHNGPDRFTVSNPQNEEADTKNGTLGHINAITSIANSNKTQDSIGKFGVGFKAVFQYTQTPHIYDSEIQFKIERFIVPRRLDSDLDWRESSETVFFFPFDHKKKQPKESHDEVLEKLKALELPVLFLSSLKSVSFEAEDVAGKYTKEVTQENEQGDITVQWITMALVVNSEGTSQHLLMFTRSSRSGHPCSIGYVLGGNGRLIPIDRPAFCFFPTKEVTNLNFILHAPFLLTDSREGIKAGERHNQELIQQLAQLAADSLPILRDEKLIDDDILDIIPYDEARFSELGDKSIVSFRPFYTTIHSRLQTEPLLPSTGDQFTESKNAYWASVPRIMQLISNKQLAYITKNNDARWVFTSFGRDECLRVNRKIGNYINQVTYKCFDEKDILAGWKDDRGESFDGISADFIKQQSYDWLIRLYQWLSEAKTRTDIIKTRSIFIDDDGNAVPAFDDKRQLVLFLPDKDISGYATVNKRLLSNKSTLEFIEKIGIKKPSLRDEIYNKILPAYDTCESLDTKPHFEKFFRYFRECRNNEVSEFIDLIKDKEFLSYMTAEDENVYRGMSSEIYLPTSDLKAWFETKPDTKFLRLDEYREMLHVQDYANLNDFLERLGVACIPRVVNIGSCNWNGRNVSDNDKCIDGLQEILGQIDEKRSAAIWKMLTDAWDNYADSMEIQRNHYGPMGGKRGCCFYRTSVCEELRSREWILNNTGELVSADVMTIQSLSNQYDTTAIGAKALISFLGIRDEAEDTAYLSEEEARKIKLADEIEQSGLSEDEIRAAIEDAKRKKNIQPSTAKGSGGSDQMSYGSPLLEEIEKRRPSVKYANSSGHQENDPTLAAQLSDTNEDVDDYILKTVDYGKKLNRAKDRCANELDRLEHEQALHDKANALPRFSYGWFLALLELECIASSEKNAHGKTISIRFGKVESDSQSSRTIVLKEPSRFIPQSIEEFSGVRVDLDFGNGRTGKLRVDSFTAKELLLLGKLASEDELSGIDLGEVLEARIEVQNPSFLLQELLERFRELKLNENFDMKENLTSDIKFIFGPPGTGKTTHLAEKILIPKMQGTKPTRLLVLTPTNKAADVLTTRIIEKMGTDTSYLNWLVRFGTSADESIEKAGVWRDRSFEISKLSHSVIVTTIARFAYDGFAVKYGSKKLNKMEWDAIVIDEASMISLASIIYPLYSQKSQKFIIAGDPFQIEPIVAVEQWKDENIYTLVGLNRTGAFAKPSTEPHDYPVSNLETQYRSIPAIGEIFSRFTYDGILKHHRTTETQRSLKLNSFDVQPINLIKFPVSKYESIYRAKRLESGTPYQTYSALFTFEFVRWLAEQIQINHADKFRIGVIAPYRAQANLLSRLNDSWVPKPNAVEIQVGTIHGFQGDECDIIIAVLNPPPAISKSPQMFLNKQNILNVAISRARDYLFIVIPDDETEGVENLHKIAEIEMLAKSGSAFSEYASRIVEEMIWGNQSYLEDNTFSTGHQMVNVYRKPERYYEVRSDESAIDVQIHE